MNKQSNPLLKDKSVSSATEGTHAFTDAILTDDERRKMRKAALIKILAMTFFVLVVLIFSSIAWFTMNKDAEGTGANMTAVNSPFDLKTIGDDYPNNSLMGQYFSYTDGDEVSKEIENVNTVVGNITSNIDGRIKWVLNSEDDFYKGVQPGAHGTLQFYVVPKDPTQNLSVTCHLHLTPYKVIQEDADDGNGGTVKVDRLVPLSRSSSVNSEKKAVDLLKGHILFFKSRDTVNGKLVYSDRIKLEENATFTVTVTPSDLVADSSTDSQKGKLVSIYWEWPITVGRVLGYNDNVSICKNTPATDQAEIENLMCSHSEMFFDIAAGSALEAVTTTSAGVTTLDSTALDRVSENGLSKYFGYMSIAYNNADQDIGISTKYILVELSAEAN